MDQKLMQTEVIAEIDDEGCVLWVWIREPNVPCARPVRDVATDRKLLGQAKCYGASCAALSRWFDDRIALEARSLSA
jgi:hypothetical protein